MTFPKAFSNSDDSGTRPDAEERARCYRKQVQALADARFQVVYNKEDDACQATVDWPTTDQATTVRHLLSTQREVIHALHEAQATNAPVTFALRNGPTIAWSGTIHVVEASEQHVKGRGVLKRTVPDADPDIEPLHRELLEMLPDALLIVGSNDRICYANSAAVSMTGAASLQALLGQSIWSYIPDRSRSEAIRRRKQVRTGTAIDFARHTLQTRHGKRRIVESASVPIVYQGRHAALIAVRDLTGREQLSETLTRTLQLFDTAFQLGPAALIVRLRDGIILEVSERMETLVGLSTADLAGQQLHTLDLDVSESMRRTLTRELLATRSIHDREVTIQPAHGASRTVLVSAGITIFDGDACALISAVDITERKQAFEQARESQALMENIFRMSPSPLAICRLDDGVYLNANDALCTLVDHPRSEIIGASDDELNLWTDATQRETVFETVRKDGMCTDVHAQFCTASGDRVDVLCSLQRLRINDDTCAVLALTDITQREAARQALVEAKQKAEDVAHFRSAVLTNITHEMRTPMTVILGFTPTLRQGLDESYTRFVDIIERSGRRLLFTLDSLLDLAQLEAGTLDLECTVHNIPELVHQLTGSLVERIEAKGLTFELTVNEAPIFSETDSDLLERVLNHVLDNAIKFTESGGITVTIDTNDNEVLIKIADTGTGIDGQFLPRAFDAFTQESEGLARTHQGSGLGLTVCKRIMERLNGSIHIETEKSVGSTVTLRLPQSSESAKTRSMPVDG